MLASYSAKLLNSLLSSNHIFVDSLGFSTSITTLSAKKVTSLFPICIPFISFFFFPIGLARIASVILNKVVIVDMLVWFSI